MKEKKSSKGIRPLSIVELANLYGVHRKTMTKWINPFKEQIGQRIGRFYSIRQLKIIFRHLGFPEELLDKD